MAGIRANRMYVLLFIILYFIAFVTEVFIYQLSFADAVAPVLFVGFGFSFIAWLLTKKSSPLLPDKPAFKNEAVVLLALIVWIILYITYGGTYINSLFARNIQRNEHWQFFIVIARKLIVFVFVPFLVYSSVGFSIKDFGLKISSHKLFTKKNVLLFIIMSLSILLFQYFFSGGAKPLRDGQFSSSQLLSGMPLTFLWMFVEAGLIEEFFFRAILQSRLSVLLKSQSGAILVGGLIFGLAHVPGLYLRGSESEGITEQFPIWFWLSYCVVNMSIAGIFLGIIWAKTRNLYVVMTLHAMVDLLPNLGSFIHIWRL